MHQQLPVIFVIWRKDLALPPGKTAAKVAQALVNAYATASPEIQKRYLADGEGTQIILTCDDAAHLMRLRHDTVESGANVSLVSENGEPMCIGVGPVHRETLRPLFEELPRMK